MPVELSTIADGIETSKALLEFLPEPAKSLVSGVLDLAIEICRRAEEVAKSIAAIVDLARQQADYTIAIYHELHLNRGKINSTGWGPKLENFGQVLRDLFKFVDGLAPVGEQSFIARAKKRVDALLTPEMTQKVEELKGKVVEARQQFELRVSVSTAIGVQLIAETVDGLMKLHKEGLTERLAQRLRPCQDAYHNVNGSTKCHGNTRVALLSDLREFLTAEDGPGPRVVWLHGLAGTGKSTAARSVCSDLEPTHDIASFFIKRDIAERSSQLNILHTLVYQLAQHLPEVMGAVVRAKDEFFGSHLHDQVERLLRWPLQKEILRPSLLPIIIVLDAVDERDETTRDECDLISCFLDAIATAQAPICVLVTSRGQPSDFLRSVHDTPHLQQTVVKAISMHHKSYDPESDIRAYLVTELERVAMTRSLSDWPSPDQINDLVRMSARLFIVAATIIRWVDCPAPVFALSQLLKQSSAMMQRTGPGTIFALYQYVIDHALDETTPQQLLRFALGKDPKDTTEADALRLEATLSILSTLRCLREPGPNIPAWGPPTAEPEPREARLTRNAFAHLWAGHLIAEKEAEAELYEGVVVVVGDLISRLSGVLFVWEPDSSMSLLHASFGDFLDSGTPRYHASSKTTHFELESKCFSIMLSTKAAYSRSYSTSLLNRRLNAIPWIPDSDLAARYSFAYWIQHVGRADPTQLPALLKQVRLAEREFWFAGLFLYPADLTPLSLQAAFQAMRIHPEGVEAAYALATAVYMCADEAIDFKRRVPPDVASLRLLSFNMTTDALSILAPLSGAARKEHERVDLLDQGLMEVLNLVHYVWLRKHRRVTENLNIRLAEKGGWARMLWSLRDRSISRREFPGGLSNIFKTNNTVNRPSDLSGFLERLISELKTEWDKEWDAQWLEMVTDLCRYGLREDKRQIIKPYDEQAIAAIDRRNAGLLRCVYRWLRWLVTDRARVDSSPSDGRLPSVDEPHPSKGQSSQVATPVPREKGAAVRTSTTSTVSFFAVLVLIYVLLSSLFA